MNRLAIIAAVPTATEDLCVQVFYGDLDTGSPAGAKVLAERVAKSVSLACEPPNVRNLRAGGAWRECQDAALTHVTEQLAQLWLVPTITVG